MIDWIRLDELRAEIGAADLADVVAMFLDEADQEIARLQTATCARATKASLHFLRGSALNLGLVALAHACADADSGLSGAAPRTGVAAVVQVYTGSRRMFLQGLASRTAA